MCLFSVICMLLRSKMSAGVIRECVYCIRQNIDDHFSYQFCFCREIHGLVGDYLSLSQVANKDPNCLLSLAGPNFFNFGLALTMRKSSPWLHDINQAVLKHQENDTIQTIEERWFNKKSCDVRPFTKLGITNFSGLFMAAVIVLGFCVFAVFVEFIVVIMLIKFGKRLGAFGKSIKRFAFNVKKGEEDQINMKYSFLLRRQRKASWNVAACTEPSHTFQELGFHNDAYTPHEQGFHSDTYYTHTEQSLHDNVYFAPYQQSIRAGLKLNQGPVDHRVNEMMNGKSVLTECKYMNGHNSSRRTKSIKQNGLMVTKL